MLSYRRAQHGWWRENDAKFRELVASGASASEAGLAMGITKNAAIGKAHRLGLVWARSPEPPVSKAASKKPLVAFPPPGHCLWGHGDLDDENFHWCGAPVASGAWCAQHRRKVYRPFREARG